MKIIKKTFITIVLLSLLIMVFLSGCSNTVIYQVEKDINAYINKMTEGYNRLSDTPTTKTYTLFKEEKVLEIKLKQGLNSEPSIDVTTGKNKKKTTESNILTIKQIINDKISVYGKSTALSLFFNPYENAYVPCMRVYKKDADNYRILFTVINGENDMFPFYNALTADDYAKLLDASERYDKQLAKSFSSYAKDNYGNPIEIPDYSDEFSKMFIPFSSLSEEAKTPILEKYPLIEEQNGYILAELGADYADYLETVFPKYAGYGMQNARRGYAAMGYTDYNPNCIIITADVVISEDGASYEISMNDDIYYSPAALASGAEYTFSFCETLNGQK